MKQGLVKKIKKHWITVWMVLAFMTLTIVAVYATYTRVTVAKRVVSTRSGAGVLFSSNYMESPAKTTIETPLASQFTGSNHPTYTVNVCNYAQGEQAIWFDRKNITYTLKARVVNYSDHNYPGTAALSGKTYKIGNQDLTASLGETGYYDFGGSTFTLSSNQASTDNYIVTLDNSDVSNDTPTYIIELVATPSSTFGGVIPTEIIGYIGIAKQTEARANWVGEISDENYDTNVTYDAYNYLIYGSGKAKLVFMWDPSQIEVSKFFLDEHTSTNCVSADNKPSGWKKIEIDRTVDDPERFDIQLYKVEGGFSSIESAVDFDVRELTVTP